jgi:hypothetical protein
MPPLRDMPAHYADRKAGVAAAGAGQDRVADTLSVFYRVERAGVARLSDGGGPFGFDVTIALTFDDLVGAYGCDAIVETGCFLGDTTTYLARRYPGLPVYSCDIQPQYAAFTARRVADASNATVVCRDSPDLVTEVCQRHDRPILLLDAHWEQQWPLVRELDAVTAGVVLVDDFDIGHPRFGFDSYDGLVCGPQVLAAMKDPPGMYWTPDPDEDFPLPCLQVGRRAGVGIVAIGVGTGPLEDHPNLIARTLTAGTAVTP